MIDEEMVYVWLVVGLFIGFFVALMFFRSPNCSVDLLLLEEQLELYNLHPEELPLGVSLTTDLQEFYYIYQQYPYVKSFVKDSLLDLVSCK